MFEREKYVVCWGLGSKVESGLGGVCRGRLGIVDYGRRFSLILR